MTFNGFQFLRDALMFNQNSLFGVWVRLVACAIVQHCSMVIVFRASHLWHAHYRVTNR